MYVHELVYKQAVDRVEQYRREAARGHAVAALRPSFRSRAVSALHRWAERLEPALKPKALRSVR